MFFKKLVSYPIVFSIMFSPVHTSADVSCEYFCVCEDEEEIEEVFGYEDLEEFEEPFREFEKKMDEEDEVEDVNQRGIFKTWFKNLKKWLKKKTLKLIRKILKIRKMKVTNREEAAYTLAKFKRRIDRKICRTKSFDKLFSSVDGNVTQEDMERINSFKERVKFYYNNKHEKPPKTDEDQYDGEKYDHVTKQIKEYDGKRVLGGLMMGCGFIIYAIPLPGCADLGKSIILSGFLMFTYINADAILEYNTENKEDDGNK